MSKLLLLILLATTICFSSGCVSPSPVAFRVTDQGGQPVRGAHARIILLDAGAPLPVNTATLEEASMQLAPGGGFTNRDGRIELPVVGTRDHLIEIEGPVLGALDPANAAVAIWVYRPIDDSLVPLGEKKQPLRVERVD